MAGVKKRLWYVQNNGTDLTNQRICSKLKMYLYAKAKEIKEYQYGNGYS